MRWSYVLRARERWLCKDDAIKSHERDATELLLSLPQEEDDLALIARADRVVMRMPYRSQEEGWAASVMPWEYLISTATRRHRRASGNSFTVMRAGWVDPRSGCRLTRAFRLGGATDGLSALAAGNHLGTSDIEYGTHSSRRAVQRAARACSLDSLRRAEDAAASIMCERLTKKEAVLSLFRRPPK